MQVPTLEPLALVQIPVQQSVLAEHRSPCCVQNDGWAAQLPFLQSFEQQSPCALQEFPAVLQLPFSGTQPASPQVPLQHWAPVVHAWLSEVQSVLPQVPPLHTRVQHSVGAEQP